jgi:ribosomal protein L29
MSDTGKAPLPDYFELLRAMTGGSPAAGGFAGLGSMPGFGANSGAAFGLPAMDPEEIQKKIRELEVVHMWLRGQAAAVELSIKTMEYQRDTLRQMGSARESAGNAFSSEEMAKVAAAFNPSAWMAQMMPNAQSGSAHESDDASNKRSSSASRAKPRAAKKRKP